MHIPLILKQLDLILKISKVSQEHALSQLGAAVYLTDFLLMVAQVNGIGNMPGVKEKLRDYIKVIQYHAGLLEEKIFLHIRMIMRVPH